MKNYDYVHQQEANVSCLLEDEQYLERRTGFLKFIQKFSNENIRFGLACSFNLFLRGIVDEFHDFDVIVEIKDIPKVKDIMEKMGATLVATGGNGFCESEVYLHYQLGRTDFDIIAGFRVLTFDTQFIYRYSEKDIEWVKIPDEEVLNIPLIPLEALYLLYSMMEGWQPRRRYKRMLIQEILSEKENMNHKDIFDSVLTEQELPGWVKRNIRGLMI